MAQLHVETIPMGPIETNCYLVWPEGRRECWVIDPGGLPTPVIKRIEKEKLEPKMIVITHGHWDHFLGNRCLKDRFPEAQIAIHELDASVLPDPEKNMSLSFIGKSILSPPADRRLKDGDELALGEFKFQVIHAPGHCPGLICLYCPEAKTLFAGDLIFAGGGVGRTDLPRSSPRQLEESLKKIFDRLPDDTTVYSGHGPATTIGDERQYR